MQMMEEHKDLFDQFKEIHDQYMINPKANQGKFNSIGEEVTSVIRTYEKELCANMKTGMYGAFSTNVSTKLWDEMRTMYPKINFIGVVIS
jgi:hypothetical protein